jgi:effector-binding domain-containing protein
MSDKLHLKINEILEGKQLSISAITRNLKDVGFDEHRLVMTGYLRALKDIGKLNEVEIPPSKVYSKVQEVENEDDFGDLYSAISKYIVDVDKRMRLPVAVYIFTRVLERPAFKEEIIKIGFSPKNINDTLDIPDSLVIESSNENLHEYISGISKIKIPFNDHAYEIARESTELINYSNDVLIKLLKSSVDVSGMVPKTKKTRLNDFG